LSSSLEDRVLAYFHDSGLRSGDVVPSELELASELKVGRPALREALGALEVIGIVQSRQGARRTLGTFDMGAVIRTLTIGLVPDLQALRSLLEVRRVLEVGFLPQAAVKLTPKEIAHLRSLTDTMQEKASRGEVFVKEDQAFHAAIYHRLDNPILWGLLEAFWELFDHMGAETRTGTNLPETAASHARIVDALAAGELALAVHHLNSHFFDVRSRLVRQSAGHPSDKQGAHQ
jgi:DNA-binding FadR family transcriptional regulator